MAIEIERRFLVAKAGWKRRARSSRRIRQAYLAVSEVTSVRIRINDSEAASLTIKSGKAGIARLEFEYPIPVQDAEALIVLRTGNLIEKRRHIVTIGEARWEVDVFAGALDGLVIAEIELDDEQRSVGLPTWLGKEITDDGRYSNAALATFGLPYNHR